MNRRKAEFARADVERLWLDTDRSAREERAAMLELALRRGDTLVLLALSDLGAGKGLRNIRAKLEGMGVHLEVVEAAKPAPARPRGRPSVWEPSAADDEKLRGMWHDVAFDGAYIIDRALDLRGVRKPSKRDRAAMRQWMVRRYGSPRGREGD